MQFFVSVLAQSNSLISRYNVIQDLVELRRGHNAIAVEHVDMSMLRVNMVEQLAKTYPVVEVEIKKFQARRLASLKKSSSSTCSAT